MIKPFDSVSQAQVNTFCLVNMIDITREVETEDSHKEDFGFYKWFIYYLIGSGLFQFTPFFLFFLSAHKDIKQCVREMMSENVNKV